MSKYFSAYKPIRGSVLFLIGKHPYPKYVFFISWTYGFKFLLEKRTAPRKDEWKTIVFYPWNLLK
jgi:hypothetical protein